MITSTSEVPFIFVLFFLFFSGIFFYNTYKLWFRTENYYSELRESLSRSPSIYPFHGFFLRQMENRKKWERVQKIFSILGMAAVLAADTFIITVWMAGI